DTAEVDKALREIPHANLLRDAATGAPGLLEFDRGVTERLMGSSRSEGALLGTSAKAKPETPMIRAFRAKLQQVIDKRIKNVGGSPGRILRSLFTKWDTELNGALDTTQLRGALRTLNMRLSATQAKEVARFYARDGDADVGCDYAQLVQDVCSYDQGPFVHRVSKERIPSAPITTSGRESISIHGQESDRSRASLHFTDRPFEKLSNRVVDRFKLRLRDVLEQTIKNKGGVSHAIIREAFLDWDADASGKLNPRELVGALQRMGVHATDDEAKAVVEYYDLDGSEEMSYELLCSEIKALSHPMLSYIEEVDVLNGLDRTVREPATVTKCLERIRTGVIAAAKRAMGSALTLPPISPRDLLEGTCLRFDTEDSGALRADELRQVWRELKISLKGSETKALVAWFDRSTTKRLRRSDLCGAVFGGGGSRSVHNRRLSGPALASRKTDQSLPQPPKPHVLQARRSAALAMGTSSCNLAACPVTASEKDPRNLQPAGKPQGLEGKTAWNWQGRPPPAAAPDREPRRRNATMCVPGGGGAGTGDGATNGDSAPGSIAPVRFGGVLQVSGEAVVAEKARIERRLKELQRERASLLREKNVVRCWGGRGKGPSASSIPANKCAA
ncbi:unnamed protein product, partial [Scytosiphon promiscuus]